MSKVRGCFGKGVKLEVSTGLGGTQPNVPEGVYIPERAMSSMGVRSRAYDRNHTVMNRNLLPIDAERHVSLDLIIYSDELSHEKSGEHGLDSENEYSIESIDERAHKSSSILEGILQRS